MTQIICTRSFKRYYRISPSFFLYGSLVSNYIFDVVKLQYHLKFVTFNREISLSSLEKQQSEGLFNRQVFLTYSEGLQNFTLPLITEGNTL